jgi:hypothetical protein
MEITSDSSIFAVLAIGFVIGLYHAIEADHLAAVAAIVSEKKNVLMSSLIGGLWGVGHTISLFAVGLLVIFLKLQISESVEAKLEALVGGMLILLGRSTPPATTSATRTCRPAWGTSPKDSPRPCCNRAPATSCSPTPSCCTAPW